MADTAQLGNEQTDPILTQYYEDLQALTQRALDGEIDQSTFEREFERIVTAAILLMFTLGGGDPSAERAQAVINAAKKQEIDALVKLSDDIYNGRYSARSEEEASRGRPEQTAEQGRDKLFNRLALWGFTLASVYAMGQLSAPMKLNDDGEMEEPRYEWEYGDTDHCRDCQLLHGVVLTASEWRRLGVQPQGSNLECGGWKCQCKLKPTDKPSIGLENVPI